MNIFIIIAIVVIVTVLIVITFESAYFYRRTMKRGKAKTERTMKMAGTDWSQYMPFIEERKKHMLAQPHEDVFVESEDGLKLHATYFPNGSQKKVVICFHGYTSEGMKDYVALSHYYLNQGFSMLLVDERAHGQSEGTYIGFGCLDRMDALKWINLIIDKCSEDVEILLHGTSMGGATVLMTSGLDLPSQVKGIAKKLEEAKGIPALIVKMKVFGKQFHTICSGGAYLNPAYIDLFKKYGITILQGYGMTECSPVISTNLSWNIKKNSVGRLMPNCQAKVVDDELWVKGSSVMQGYYKMPEETAQTLKDGWLVTGDLGYVDDDGYIFLTGRKKNLIITKNGENVSPEEIENKIGENRLVCEILVRENEGVIEAEIFPDYEYAEKKKIKNIQDELQKIIDEYNLSAPAYKKVYKLSVREKEFEKTPSKKIKRY